ncbi:MAG: phosphoribosylformylglycinamidine synthase subunit PurL, partial [Patescibacteria group bacterium]
PTDIELESLAQTWSEHCKHTIFADPIDEVKEGLYKTYIKNATKKIRTKKKKDFCVSVFHDNSGAIEFDKDFLITHKVETHNSPSALDPFGGSITGIVGVNRDTIGFGLGAKPVANMYGFCVGDPNDKALLYRDSALSQPLLSPRRILDGVISGVNSGGNCSGIPTPQGFVWFDDRYKGKPLVFVGTVGLIPKKAGRKLLYKKKAQAGDYIVVVGGRVGKDGIHGATFSSEALNQGSPSAAVQIGDPITQKKLSDALVKEARDLGLYSSITDNGAGGISCSVAEMAKECGGAIVELEKVPLKYPGLDPWQIWISESQERMTLSVPKRSWHTFSDLMKRRGVEATVIGRFTKAKKCIVLYKGKKIMDIEMAFLHNGLPPRPMQTVEQKQASLPLKFPVQKNYTDTLLGLLRQPNISSFEFISQQYDHEVQSSSVLKPLQGRGRVNADATIIRPLLSSQKGVVLSLGLYPTYSDISCYDMAAAAIDTAVRNAVAAGADPEYLALLDNFCWCSPNEPEYLYRLKESAKACYDVATEYGTPFIAGKDSMYNDFKGYNQKGKEVKVSIPPTLLISSVGVIDNVSNSVSIDLKFTGDLIYLLGETTEELGGSEYLNYIDKVGGTVPKVDTKKNKTLYKKYHQLVKKRLICSAISVGRGGLAVSIAKTAMAGRLGVDISLNKIYRKNISDTAVLFSESQGRMIVSIDPKNKKVFEKKMAGSAFALIGKVTEDMELSLKNKEEKVIIESKIDTLLQTYRSLFKTY